MLASAAQPNLAPQDLASNELTAAGTCVPMEPPLGTQVPV